MLKENGIHYKNELRYKYIYVENGSRSMHDMQERKFWGESWKSDEIWQINAKMSSNFYVSFTKELMSLCQAPDEQYTIQ